MWIFTTKGFLSIVQHNAMLEHFQVKSRTADPLNHFWPDYEIEVIDWADYRYRITITKEDVIPIIAEEIKSVDYTSFKNQCSEYPYYYETLGRIWLEMYQYQHLMETN